MIWITDSSIGNFFLTKCSRKKILLPNVDVNFFILLSQQTKFTKNWLTLFIFVSMYNKISMCEQMVFLI